MSKPHLQHYVDALNPTQRYLVTEFVDNYEDGLMGRRDLLERVLRITGSAAAAAGTLLALGCAPARPARPRCPRPRQRRRQRERRGRSRGAARSRWRRTIRRWWRGR